MILEDCLLLNTLPEPVQMKRRQKVLQSTHKNLNKSEEYYGVNEKKFSILKIVHQYCCHNFLLPVQIFYQVCISLKNWAMQTQKMQMGWLCNANTKWPKYR